MPVRKFDANMVRLIAEEAGVPEKSVWIDLPKTAEDKARVYFWTTQMSRKEFERLASTNAAGFTGSHGGGLTRRRKVAAFLEHFNAVGYLTKVNPREAKPQEKYPLAGPREWCDCGEKLLTSQEEYIGKCEGCCPK